MLARSLFARNPLSGVCALLGLSLAAACAPVEQAGYGPADGLGGSTEVDVALLVPESSPEGGQLLARSLENAARLAIADLRGAEVNLAVYDSGGVAGTAAEVARRAVDEGADVILGPVFAGEANAAGNAVAAEGVNVLAFSNNTDVAGGNVYVLGQTFQDTADRLVRYAVTRDRGDIFIVNGRNTAERTGRLAIDRAIVNSGARLAGQADFPVSQQGVREAAPGIADSIQGSGADAVFFTSGTAGALPMLVDELPDEGVSPAVTQFIGLQRLDVPDNALSLPGLQGAWFALPDPNTTETFRTRYRAAYGGDPHPIAGLAYDGIAAIGALAQRGEAPSAAALTRGSGFAGTGGPFRLLPDGTNERALAVATIRDNQVSVLDPAPRSFGGYGF